MTDTQRSAAPDYQIADRSKAIAPGGIGAIHLLARRLGLVRDIDENIHLLKRHAFDDLGYRR